MSETKPNEPKEYSQERVYKWEGPEAISSRRTRLARRPGKPEEREDRIEGMYLGEKRVLGGPYISFDFHPEGRSE